MSLVAYKRSVRRWRVRRFI